MIFVTVGTQLSFDRLVKAIDDWAAKNPHHEVFAQIGPSILRPQHIRWGHFLAADKCRQKMMAADVIVSHAGMGSIITALELTKPIIIMPRRAGLNEHRNDHQLATARQFTAQGRVMIAWDETELSAKLELAESFKPAERISPRADAGLLKVLREFVVGPALGIPEMSGPQEAESPQVAMEL